VFSFKFLILISIPTSFVLSKKKIKKNKISIYLLSIFLNLSILVQKLLLVGIYLFIYNQNILLRISYTTFSPSRVNILRSFQKCYFVLMFLKVLIGILFFFYLYFSINLKKILHYIQSTNDNKQ